MRLGKESDSVQKPLVDYAVQTGWKYVPRNKALEMRSGMSGFLFRQLFITQLYKLNPGFMNDEIAGQVAGRFERLKPNIEGNLESWEFLKGLRTVYVREEKRERDIILIDTQDITNNEYHVTDEFDFTNNMKTIRQDVVFLVNGIPVLFIETKSAHKKEGIEEALAQITRYHRDCPELLAVNQVYAMTHILKYYYSATWNTSLKYIFDWKEEVKGNFETLVKTFLDRERVVRLITDYILFTRKDDELAKVILRPHQIRAVQKIVERAEDKEKKCGLIWHTQGSGKTYTMIVAAKKLIENTLLKNPAVIMLIDRNELQTQLSGNITAAGIEQVEIARNKKDLLSILQNDTRGLIISMIHKFDFIPQNINTRDNIFVLVDEAHRTTGGTLGNYLLGALPNATYIGFTGTPIDKTQYGKGTFIVFGKDDPPKGYLDKYGITESIIDKTTVPLHYTLAPNNMLVDKETLEKEFFALADLEGVSDFETLNKALQRAVNLKNMLKNQERIRKVAEYIACHFTNNVEPLGYKAFIVGVDREACAKYKQEIDKYLPSEYSEVVYSAGHNDTEDISEYHHTEEEEKRIRKAFRKPESLPKILIVTEKLLTGFDAPVLYCMYLDKPMRDHVLLQTIARVNRPYEDEAGRAKPCGFILDFVGIFENLEKALQFDSHDIEGVVQDIELLKTRFKELIERARHIYLPIIAGKTRDKLYEALLDFFMDEKTREEFYRFFKELSEIYDIVSPDAFLAPFIDDYENMALIYVAARENYEHRVLRNKEFSKKTAKLVQEHTSSGKIQSTLQITEINEELLKKIEESRASDTEKVFNLIKSINKTVEESIGQPYLIPIGEKAWEVAENFKKRQKDTQETLEELKKVADEINKAKKEQAEKQMPEEVFTVYWIMKSYGIDSPEEKARQMLSIMQEYPHFHQSEAHEREIRKELYKILLNSRTEDKTSSVKEIVDRIIKVLKSEYARSSE